MSWMEYRLVNHKRTNERGEIDVWYEINEVYFDKSGSAHTIASAPPSGITVHDVEIDAMMMAEAFKKPVLYFDEETLKFVESSDRMFSL